MSTMKEIILAEMEQNSGAGFDFGALKTSPEAANIKTSRTEIENWMAAIRREQAEQERQERLAEFLAHHEKVLRSDYPDLEAEVDLDGESGKSRIILWPEGKPRSHFGMMEFLVPEGKAAGV